MPRRAFSPRPASSPSLPRAVTPEQLVEEIRKRANAIYLARGLSGPGSELTDWLDAEKEIKAKHGIKG
jgi:hypothetical protein